MKPIEIIEKYYAPGGKAHELLVGHSKMVRRKALEIARNLEEKKGIELDKKFIEEAAMLHDVGVFLVNDPEIGCFGKEPYIKHGTLGRQILEKEGLNRHALVCERHVGVGISKEEIEKEKLPLPSRDMLPESMEEKIICLADLFFSKSGSNLKKESTIEKIKSHYEKFGDKHVKRLENLIEELLV